MDKLFIVETISEQGRKIKFSCIAKDEKEAKELAEKEADGFIEYGDNIIYSSVLYSTYRITNIEDNLYELEKQIKAVKQTNKLLNTHIAAWNAANWNELNHPYNSKRTHIKSWTT